VRGVAGWSPARQALTWSFVERVTRIELALSAWEAQRLRLPGALTRRPWRSQVTLADPSSPWLMTLNRKSVGQWAGGSTRRSVSGAGSG